ncbi:hypothetical protein FB565_002789 [Actinoplanes lutulentus]|uniref:Uncharacterized protein n=1 Tax=Actinoplanes lutulentus TaxID=1287878 RepID=A0A327YYE1_9ACTN|nr:hypothetical protein [Actinoplanes lutulentus]MBB2943076.1 hypothetical protein [Actinoplanes lutulentus]RAK26658.1 hypothetical protein B0I29_12647 [Actinoplanes lutulentus]
MEALTSDPLLSLARAEMVRRLTTAAGQMSATVDVLTTLRDLAGDVRGTESMRVAIEELTRTRDQLLGQAKAITACAPVS